MIQIIVHSDAGDSNGEIPKKDPLFALVLLRYIDQRDYP